MECKSIGDILIEKCNWFCVNAFYSVPDESEKLVLYGTDHGTIVWRLWLM
jgi:hypothetical protein